MKSNQPPQVGAYVGVFCGKVPQICIKNQRIRYLKRKLRKEGRDPHAIGSTTPSPWAHQPRSATTFLRVVAGNAPNSQPRSDAFLW
jgi:hypothetical protein